MVKTCGFETGAPHSSVPVEEFQVCGLLGSTSRCDNSVKDGPFVIYLHIQFIFKRQ